MSYQKLNEYYGRAYPLADVDGGMSKFEYVAFKMLQAHQIANLINPKLDLSPNVLFQSSAQMAKQFLEFLEAGE